MTEKSPLKMTEMAEKEIYRIYRDSQDRYQYVNLRLVDFKDYDLLIRISKEQAMKRRGKIVNLEDVKIAEELWKRERIILGLLESIIETDYMIKHEKTKQKVGFLRKLRDVLCG